ncbi:MAG: lipopolysaccharide biosynthesis protein [Cyanobacteriota bacterium]
MVRTTSGLPLRQRLLRAGAVQLLAPFCVLACGMAVFVYLSRALGPGAYGTYALAAAISQWLGLGVVAVGGGSTVPLVAGDAQGHRYAVTILRATLLMAVLLAGVLLASAGWIGTLLRAPELVVPLRLLAFDLPLAGLATTQTQILQGQGRFQAGAGLQVSSWLLRIGLAWVLVEQGLGVTGACLALPLASLAQLVGGRCLSGIGLVRGAGIPLGQLLGRSRRRMAETLLMGIFSRIDLVALQAWGPSAQITGLFAAAKNLSYVPGMVFTSSGAVVLQALAAAHGRQDEGQAARLGRAYLLAVLQFCGLVLAVVPLMPAAVAAVLGPRYLQAGPVAAVLVGATAVHCLGHGGRLLLNSRGERGAMARSLAVLIPLFVLLEATLAQRLPPPWSALGIALATAAGSGLISLITLSRVAQLGRSGPAVLPSAASLGRTALAAAFCAVVGWGLSAHGLATGVAGIGASLVAVTLLYGALLAPQLRSAVGLS